MQPNSSDSKTKLVAEAKPIVEAQPAAKDKPVATKPEAKPNKPAKETQKKKSAKGFSDKKKFTTGLVTLIVGVTVLVAGVVMLLLNVLSKPAVRDADYLVEVGKWEREDTPGVIWDFTEIGKGTLTTNNHTNDYDFIWAIDDGTIKIETSWLYTLNNDYDYTLKQGDDALLTLTTGEGEELVDINFHPASSVDPEVTEDN